jgi:hypothetical protein
LRRNGVRRATLVLALDGGRQSGEVIRALRSRIAIGEIWAPSSHQIRDARTPDIGSYRAGSFVIDVTATSAPLAATLRVASPP